ncbi:MAG TPA: Gfo/Idh/MocA family oxidoreductase [Candidatus Hydrogenedentes bacterium]|nr:Gfo/Idh/MocA family oxidoreductase [Candidatus Hydrogenedentota bacterium]HPG67302.1 Gfo/Idh/MocA family oxidoreductase [Candidatus Hydrogenedentota bacterium]
MMLRIGFVGFRHGHIFSLYNLLRGREDVVIVGACEEDEETRAGLAEKGVTVTHDSYGAMLEEVECDAVACGDYYGVRGEELIRALDAGRHVIGDKPLCTRLDELDRIEDLARAKDLRVGCMLDLVDAAPYRTLRRVIREGAIGEVRTMAIFGQHPLFFGARPAWYFEQGKHGGTINDIAIHAVDAIPWMTGRAIVEVTAARAWNARLKEVPSFQDGAQFMLRLDNNGGVLGDVSYLTPEAPGYAMPIYWHVGVHGDLGYAEATYAGDHVRLFRKEAQDPLMEALDPPRPGGYFDDFLADVAGHADPEGLHTERVLRSARIALTAQAAADSGGFPCGV